MIQIALRRVVPFQGENCFYGRCPMPCYFWHSAKHSTFQVSNAQADLNLKGYAVASPQPPNHLTYSTTQLIQPLFSITKTLTFAENKCYDLYLRMDRHT